MQQARDDSTEALWKSDSFDVREFVGSEDELVRSGLAKPDWFPGKAGINTTRQTVFFNEDGSVTLRGKGGGELVKEAKGRRWVTIVRKSKRRYAVERSYLPSESRLKRLHDDFRTLIPDFEQDRPHSLSMGGHWQLLKSSSLVMRAAIKSRMEVSGGN